VRHNAAAQPCHDREEHLQRIGNKLVNLNKRIKHFPIVVQSVDNQKRNLDELFGIYQAKCREINLLPIEKATFKAFINLLVAVLGDSIGEENSLYYRVVSEEIAINRLNKMGRFVYETTG
jgi:hypothetical protein